MAWCPVTNSDKHKSGCYEVMIVCGNSDPNHKHRADCRKPVGPKCGGTP